MNTIYLSDNQIVMNYNRMYPKNRDTLLKSDTFRFVLEYFMDEIQNPTILKYLTIDNSINIHPKAVIFPNSHKPTLSLSGCDCDR